MAKQYAVIGLGKLGGEVVDWLSKKGYQVLAIDKRRERIDEISSKVGNALSFDTTSETALLDARINEMDVVVCAIGDHHIQDSIMTTALLRQIGVKKIIARASTDLHGKILKVVGADEIINPEKQMGDRIAQKMVTPGLSEIIPLAEDAAIAELDVPGSFVGKNVVELRIRSRYGVNIIGVRRIIQDSEIAPDSEAPQRKLLLTLKSEELFQKDDILVVVGNEKDVKKFAEID